MANILGLALKITADGSGVPAALTPVERALKQLETETAKVVSVFDKFAGTSDAAAAAQSKTAAAIEELTRQRQAGAISAEEFVKQFQAVKSAADEEAKSLERAAQITKDNISPIEQYRQKFSELVALRQQGKISIETYNAALEKARTAYNNATGGAKDFGDAVSNQSLKFNELSGIFATLPGPLGDIAGRFSGLASAGEGLARVFAGGLQNGLSAVISSVTALVNPFTLAAAGVAAFAAAATALANGLRDLESRVEKLGNTADKLGTSFEFVQTLEEAANRSGTSIDAVSAAFGRLQKNILGVDEESNAAAAALATIGVSAEELRALKPEDQYRLIGERIAAIEDPAKRTATATQLFGKAGADLLPFFNNLGKAEADMARFGATISRLDRSRIDNLGDAFDGIGVAVRGLGQSVLLPFAGLVEGVVKALSSVVNVVTLVAQAIGAVLQPVLDGIGQAFGLFGDAINGTIGFFRSFFQTAESTSDAVDGISTSVERSAEEVEALSKALNSSNTALNKAIESASEFGQAGFDAANKFQQALVDLQDQVDEGELNAEQYARGVANATVEYERQIEAVKRATDAERRRAEEVQRRAEAEAQDIQKIIDLYLERQRIDKEFAGDESRLRAAEKVAKIEAEIGRVVRQIEEARQTGDRLAVLNLSNRLATLDQIQAQERDIASGAAAARADAEKFAAEELKRRQELAREIEKLNEEVANKQAALLEKQFEVERERAQELLAIRTGAISLEDIRTGGISAFFQTLREDPAVGEARKQTKELQRIREEIAKLQAEKVDILAGNG